MAEIVALQVRFYPHWALRLIWIVSRFGFPGRFVAGQLLPRLVMRSRFELRQIARG